MSVAAAMKVAMSHSSSLSRTFASPFASTFSMAASGPVRVEAGLLVDRLDQRGPHLRGEVAVHLQQGLLPLGALRRRQRGDLGLARPPHGREGLVVLLLRDVVGVLRGVLH